MPREDVQKALRKSAQEAGFGDTLKPNGHDNDAPPSSNVIDLRPPTGSVSLNTDGFRRVAVNHLAHLLTTKAAKYPAQRDILAKSLGISPADIDALVNPTKTRGTVHGRLLVLGMDDLDTAPPRDYLLKGVISPNEISIWVGPPKSGKSFLLMYVSYMLALGRSVFGRRVKPTKVLYVAAEGEAGINKRLQALRAKYGPAENFHYIAQPIDLLRDDGHKDEITDAAKAGGAEIIVIDTLNRAIPGGDENSSVDMGLFIANISDIRNETRCHIAVIHHGTKASDGRTPRGHSSLEGADDALVEVQKLADGSRAATLVHSKDDADGMRWAFTLALVELGTDDDGDKITTLIVVEDEAAQPRAAREGQTF